jgi:hypothetical protein
VCALYLESPQLGAFISHQILQASERKSDSQLLPLMESLKFLALALQARFPKAASPGHFGDLC